VKTQRKILEYIIYVILNYYGLVELLLISPLIIVQISLVSNNWRILWKTR